MSIIGQLVSQFNGCICVFLLCQLPVRHLIVLPSAAQVISSMIDQYPLSSVAVKQCCISCCSFNEQLARLCLLSAVAQCSAVLTRNFQGNKNGCRHRSLRVEVTELRSCWAMDASICANLCKVTLRGARTHRSAPNEMQL